MIVNLLKQTNKLTNPQDKEENVRRTKFQQLEAEEQADLRRQNPKPGEE